MNYVERAIRDAEKAGMKIPTGYQFVLATNARCFGENTANQMFYIWLLSKPETWQALGKARGWGAGDLRSDVPVWDWRGYWHEFIDHLADDKDANSFFSELYQTRKDA